MYQLAFQRDPAASETRQALELVSLADAEPVLPPSPPKPSPWHYGHGDFDAVAGRLGSFNPLPHFEKDSWQGGKTWPNPALGWLRLTAEGGHPGEGSARAVVRRWVAPQDAAVRVSGELAHQATEGDGIHAALVHRTRGLLASWVLQNQKAETSFGLIHVKQGEWLDFIVSCRSNVSHDDFRWAPVIARVDAQEQPRGTGEPISWNARKDFAGPPPAPLQPLDGWSALAQALLISNEFVFVD
jgi:hypothetical protein